MTTATIPIVMALSANPVESGIVTNLARPGGNLTGMTTSFDWDMHNKRLQLLKEAVPNISRVGVIYRTPTTPATLGQPFSVVFKDLIAQAQLQHVTLIPLLVDGPDQLPAVSAALAREHVEALLVDDTAVNAQLRREIGELAAKHRVPWTGGASYFDEAGALLVYGANGVDLRRRAAPYVGPNPEGREAGRPPHRAAHEVRSGCQPQRVGDTMLTSLCARFYEGQLSLR